MHCRMWLGARFLCLLSVCSSLTWVGGQGPRGGQAAGDWMGRDTRRQKGTGRAGCACHGSGGLVRPSHCACYRLEGKPEAMPLCLCGAGTIGGWLFQVPPGEPRAGQTFPPTPSEGLGKEGSQAGWVLRGGPRRPVSGMEASATAPAAAQLLPVSLCRVCRGCWAWPQRGQVPVTAVAQCPGWALPFLMRAASPCGRVAVPDGLGAAVGHLLPR